MRRTASVLGVALILFGGLPTGPAVAAEICIVNPIDSTIECHESGTVPGTPDDPRPDPDRTGPRYVYTATDAIIGDCHYWSNVPGGLDAWDPADDAAVIAANALPVCPGGVAPVDIPATAWQIFRSWDLDPPDPSLQPLDRGITGLPTFLSSPDPVAISHSELLPDGRPLQVRASVTQLRIDWGDNTRLAYDPAGADPYPDGTATHTYRTKTCSAEYRDEHPSGGLCHRTLEYYTITAIYRWVGEYNVGSGWVQLGILDRAVSVPYDIDEVRGVPVPTP
jgi:hypothetical protein